MKSFDRLIALTVLLVIAAVVVQAAIGALVTLAIIGTACFGVVRFILFYTGRW